MAIPYLSYQINGLEAGTLNREEGKEAILKKYLKKSA
jgi:hypothetical protein